MKKRIDRDREELLASEELTIHLHWDATLDLDIFAIYETKDGKRELIYFASSGSQEEFPFIELLFDFEFSEIPVDNQEIIALSKMEVEKIWIFAWDFDAVQEARTINFQEQKVFLEIRAPKKVLLTDPKDLGEGNLALMGVFRKLPSTISSSPKRLSFSNLSEMRIISLPEQMEDLLNILL